MKARSWLLSMGCTVCAASVALAQANSDSVAKDTAAPRASPEQPEQPTIADTTQGATEDLTASERDSLNQLHQANVTQIEAGKLAERRARNATIKRYGKLLARDQAQADRELKQLAEQVGVALTPPPDNHLDALKRTWDAADFDRRFLNLLARDQSASIRAVERAQAAPETEAVQAFLAKNLPRIQTYENTTLLQLRASPF